MSGNTRAEFTVDLNGNLASKSDAGAAALERLKGKLKEDVDALSQMQQAWQRLQNSVAVKQFQNAERGIAGLEKNLSKLRAAAKPNTQQIQALEGQLKAAREQASTLRTDPAVKQFLKLGSSIAQMKGRVGEGQAKVLELGGGLEKAGVSAAKGAEGLDSVTGAASAVGGPLGGVAGRLSNLRGLLAKSGGGAMLFAAAVVAITVATIAGITALASYALQIASSARATRLLFQAATGSAEAGKSLEGVVTVVSSRVATARGELNEMALSVARVGLAGRSLEAAFSAVATASATMGQAAGGKIQAIAEQSKRAKRFILGAFDLQGTGVKFADVATALSKELGISFGAAVDAIRNGRVRVEAGLVALDAAVQKKLGAVARAQMLTFDAQVQRLRDNVSGLFKDVKITPFLESLHGVLSLLDQSTVTGTGLKAIMEGLLDPLFGDVGTIGPAVKLFFQGGIIASLQFTVALLKLRRYLKDTFGGSSLGGLNAMKAGMLAAKVVIGAVVISFAALASVLATIGAFFAALYAPIYLIIQAFAAVVGAIQGGIAAFKAGGWAGLGKFIIDGLVNGIKSGAGFVLDAIKGLGAKMVGGLKSALGIASPSKVFASLGAFSAKGFAIGIDQGSPEAERAVEGMISIPSREKPASTGASAGARAGGNTYIFHITGVENAETLKEPSFLEKMADALEGVAVGMGAPLEPEAA